MLAPELVDRIRTVLREMSLLSESSGTSYDGDRVKGGTAKSKPPPGVRFGSRDLRDLSLAEFWRARFQSVKGDQDRLAYFLFLAELDLARATKRQPGRDPHETPEAREARVIAQYEGLDPVEAAVMEDVGPIWIQQVRMKNGREPDSGLPHLA